MDLAQFLLVVLCRSKVGYHCNESSLFLVTQMANMIGYAPLVDKGFQVQYNSEIGDEFLVAAPSGEETIFARTPKELYAFEPSIEFLNEMAKAKGIKLHTEPRRHQSHVIDTVKGNMEVSERQVRYAKLIRKTAFLTYPTEEKHSGKKYLKIVR